MKKLDGEYFKINDLLLVSDDNFCDEIHIYKYNNLFHINIENVGDFGIDNCNITFSKEKMLKFIESLNKKIR